MSILRDRVPFGTSICKKDCVMTKKHFYGGGDLHIRRAKNQRGIAEFYAKHGRVPPLAFHPDPVARELLDDFAQIEGEIAAQQVGVYERFVTMPKAIGTLQ